MNLTKLAEEMERINCTRGCGNISLRNQVPSVNASHIPDIELGLFLRGDIATVVYLSVLIVVGIFANLHAIVCYSNRKRTNFTELVLFLTVVQLTCVIICLPLNIMEIRYRYTFPDDTLCKFTRFVSYSAGWSSAAVLFIMALERNRQICHSLSWQFSIGRLRAVISLFIITSYVISLPKIPLSGQVQKKIANYPDLQGRYCGTVKTSVDTVYTGSLFVVWVLFSILMTVQYGQVIREIIKTKLTYTIREQISDVQVTNSDCPTFRTDTLKSQSSHTTKLDLAMRHAIIFMIVTLISYLISLPTIVVAIVRAAGYDDVESRKVKDFNGIEFLTRLPYMNVVVNPLVFFYMDGTFRNQCKRWYSRKCNVSRTRK